MLLKELTPSDTLVGMVDNMLDQLSKLKSGDIVERRKELQNQILLIERKVEQFLDRIAAADNAILITSYERQIKTLEEQRLVLQERIQKCGEFDSTVTETARTAVEFLMNPYAHWVSADMSDKRL